LQQINDELDRLKSTVESFLNDHENFALIPQIIKEAIKTNKGIVSPSWVSRKFNKGYSRSFGIIDLMVHDGLIKPRKSRTKNSFRVRG
jgi:hypothetical protein